MPPNTARLFLWIVGGTYAVLALSFAPRTTPYFRPWERLLDPDGDRFVPSATITMPTSAMSAIPLMREAKLGLKLAARTPTNVAAITAAIKNVQKAFLITALDVVVTSDSPDAKVLGTIAVHHRKMRLRKT